MGDFNRKGKFFQKSTNEREYLSLAQKIRAEIFSDSQAIFSGKDLQKRARAFSDVKNLKNRYLSQVEGFDPKKKKELLSAIDLDDAKITKKMKNSKIEVYLDWPNRHIPLIDMKTKRAYTLYDFFSDHHYLGEKRVSFEVKLQEIDIEALHKFFPKLNCADLLAKIHKEKRLRHPILCSVGSTELEFVKENSKTITMKGEAFLKDIPHRFQMENSEVPGDINQAIDELINRYK